MKHSKDDADIHCSLLASELVATKRELEETKSKLALVESRRNFSLPVRKPPDSFVHTWRIGNWSQKILEAKAGVRQLVKSNPFYVTPGYHVYLGAYPDHNARSHLAVSLFIKEGDFDDSIKWPFPFSFTTEVVDQQSDGKNTSHKFPPPYGDALEAPAIRKVSKGHGTPRMASHKTLETQSYIGHSLFAYSYIRTIYMRLCRQCVCSDSSCWF